MRNRFIGIIGALILYTLAIFCPNKEVSLVGTYVFSIALGVMLLLFLYKLKDQLQDKTYWGLIFSVIACQLLADSVAAVRELILGLVPDSIVGDISLGGIPTFLILSIWYVSFKEKNIKEVGEKLVRSIALISSFVYLMYLVFFENMQGISNFTVDEMVIRVFLILDLILITSMMLTFFKRTDKEIKKTYIIVKALGVLLYTLADIIYLYWVHIEMLAWGSVIDLLWVVGLCLIVLSVWCEVNEVERHVIRGSTRVRDYSSLLSNILGVIVIGIIASLDITIESKILIMFILFMAYIYIMQIDVYLQRHDLQKVNVILEEQVNQIYNLNQQLLESNKLLEDMTRVDFLTKLGNRRAFEVAITQIIERIEGDESKGFSIILIDLNRFKSINDWYGHNIGDEVIISIAQKLKESVPIGCIVTRQGGDEFMVLIPEQYRNEEVLSITEQIREGVAGPLSVLGHEFIITFSMGVACYPIDGNHKDTLIKNADIAMYRAKKQGDNEIVFCNSSKKDEVLRNIRIEHLLKSVNFEHEFYLKYQPQVDIVQNDKLIGFEALLRWENEELGQISPAEFIPIAEESGEIARISKWVVEKAIEQIVKWNAHYGTQLKVGINISPNYFYHNDFIEDIDQSIHRYEAKTKWIDIEITEEISMKDCEKMQNVLQGLKSRGIKISIDDFGTGYSSFSYLTSMNFDTLKIAMPFIRYIDRKEEDYQVVKAIINMAKILRINVIAEGVETKEQLDKLHKLGCNEIQGYYFSQPLNVMEAERFIEKAMSVN